MLFSSIESSIWFRLHIHCGPYRKFSQSLKDTFIQILGHVDSHKDFSPLLNLGLPLSGDNKNGATHYVLRSFPELQRPEPKYAKTFSEHFAPKSASAI